MRIILAVIITNDKNRKAKYKKKRIQGSFTSLLKEKGRSSYVFMDW